MIARLGLKSRAITFCVLLVLGAVGTISAVLIQQNYKDSISRVTQHAVSQARSISRSAAPAVLLDDHDEMNRVLLAAASDDALQLGYIIQLGDSDPECAFFRRSRDFVPEAEFQLARPMSVPVARDALRVERTDNQLLVVVPVWPDITEIDLGVVEQEDGDHGRAASQSGSPVGFVCLVYGFAQVHAELADRVRASVAIACVVVVIGIGLTVVIVRQLLGPVQDLVASTSAIAEGDLAERAPDQVGGEIGDLARAFNHMADRLEKSYASIERKVSERTAELEDQRRELQDEVAERKRAEREIERLSRQNELILDWAGEGIYGLDLEGRTTFVNPAAARMIGWEVDELAGQAQHDVLHHSKPDGTPYPREECPIYAAFRDGSVHQVDDEVFWRKDGTSFPVEYMSTPIREHGELVGAVVVFRDITERKQSELEMQEAKEAAEAANRAKSEFLANMSHEIRTPMNGIMGMTELALGTSLNGEQREYLTTVMKCSNSLLTLLNDILDLSKIEAGKMVLDTVEFDPVSLMESVLDLLSYGAVEKRLDLMCDIGAEVPRLLRGDATRLRQVLINLAGNAVKFTEQGEVVIAVKVEKQQDGVAALLFSVRDTGIGIPEEQREGIFESFTQADGATTRKYGGTGLGLAISKQIIGLMGGDIWFQSEAGKGSIFCFRVTCEVPDDAESSPDPVAPRLDGQEILDGKHILVVDQNPTSRRILAQMLDSWGCQWQSASNGDEALEMLQSAADDGRPFHLVILDAQLSDMDGLQIEHTIRGHSRYGDPYIVLLTSLGEKCPSVNPNESTPTRHIPKPVKQSTLLDALLSVFTGRGVCARYQTSEQASPAGGSGEPAVRILLVEDNAVNRMVASNILKKHGHQVTIAENGQAALDTLEHTEFDLVFMDVQMPEMDGFEATRRIRSHALWRKLPVIAMTAHAMAGDRQLCLQAGMDDYIPKPVKAGELCQMVDKWMSTPSTSVAAAEPCEHPSTEAEEQVMAPLSSSKQDSADRSMPGSTALDVEKALERLGGDRELYDEVLAVFLENLPKVRRDLQSAFSATDAHQLQFVAHSLKGSASNICAQPTCEVAHQLERMGKQGEVRQAGPLLEELEAHLDRLEQSAALLMDC